MIVSMILATTKNALIGKGDHLPWHEPVDFEWFKSKTRHKAILMGHRTQKGINRALPNRLNIVMSNDPYWDDFDDILTAPDLYDAIQVAKSKGYNELVICGGPTLYNRYFDLIDKLYVTRLEKEYEGDVYLTNPGILRLVDCDLPDVLIDGWLQEEMRIVNGVGTFKTLVRVM